MSNDNSKILLIPIAIYIGIFALFAVNLSSLNKELLFIYDVINAETAVSLLGYNGYQPVFYLVFSVILIVSGGFLIYFYWKQIKRYCETVMEVLISIGSMIVILCLMYKVVDLIAIPIFQALLCLAGIGTIIIAAVFNPDN